MVRRFKTSSNFVASRVSSKAVVVVASSLVGLFRGDAVATTRIAGRAARASDDPRGAPRRWPRPRPPEMTRLDGRDARRYASSGATPTFMAAHNDAADAARVLARRGADVAKATANGATPVAVAARAGNRKLDDAFAWTVTAMRVRLGHAG